MPSVDDLARATAGFQRRLDAVDPDQWEQPSVCDGWTVRDVADHVIGGNRFAVGMLAGHDPARALEHARALGFQGDPAQLHRVSAVAQIEAFSEPGALDRVVHHPGGDVDGRTFLAFRLGDLVLHGWDLARSTGGDESLDEELLPVVWATYQPMLAEADSRGAFGVGPSGAVPDDAPLGLRLLDLTGRRP
jgi:uncharacterized protein (TIGR03086 family)